MKSSTSEVELTDTNRSSGASLRVNSSSPCVPIIKDPHLPLLSSQSQILNTIFRLRPSLCNSDNVELISSTSLSASSGNKDDIESPSKPSNKSLSKGYIFDHFLEKKSKTTTLVDNQDNESQSSNILIDQEPLISEQKQLEPLLKSSPFQKSDSKTDPSSIDISWSFTSFLKNSTIFNNQINRNKTSNIDNNWSIESKKLLSITYTRADMALPSHTNMNSCWDYSTKFVCNDHVRKKIRLFNNNNNNHGYNQQFFMDSYDNQDIVFIESLENVELKSLNFFDDHNDNLNCTKYDDLQLNHSYQAIRVHLRSKHNTKFRFQDIASSIIPGISNENSNTSRTVNNRVIDELQKIYDNSEYNQDVIKDNHHSKNMEEKNDKQNEIGFPSLPWDHEVTSDTFTDQTYGPVITFLLTPPSAAKAPSQSNKSLDEKTNDLLHMPPPLLWKVHLPPDPTISLESITVLDGNLNVHTSPEIGNDEELNENGDHDYHNDNFSTTSLSSSVLSKCTANHATDIYINGFQSWSYTGSVPVGKDQPTSAMPDFLSKAFNHGARIPPANHDMGKASSSSFCGCCTKKNSNSFNNYKSNIATKVRRSIQNYRRCPSVAESIYVNEEGNGDFDDDCFHKVSFYKSDFYTCVTNNGSNGDVTSTATRPLSSCTLDENGGPALVLGFLSQHKQFGLITFDSHLNRVAMHATLNGVIPTRSVETDWAYCQILPSNEFYDEEPLVYYLNAVSAFNKARPMEKCHPLTGWCSWYHYYENIDADTLNLNFNHLGHLTKKVRSDVCIIDDGYITAWGDWDSFKSHEFPDGRSSMKTLADTIRKNGMKPGLWMAPFACDKWSKLCKDHPDWIIVNDEGRIANSSNCGKFFYGLDATNPKVREYAYNCIRRAVYEWGFEVLKLDFLYAACLVGNGKYDLTLSRAETMHLALRTLRDAAGPDTFLIGCGCPIGPAVGIMDAMRISADTGPTWYPSFPLPWWDNATLPSLRAMIRNSLTRAILGHRFWHNDPDCVLLGETTNLTDDEVVSAATVVSMTGGMFLLSDDLDQLNVLRLRIATRIYPLTGVTGVVLNLHNSCRSGIPSLLRLWCTDSVTYNLHNNSNQENLISDPIALARENSLRASFSPDKPWLPPTRRDRSCIPVAAGLGSWSVVSISNWLDVECVMKVPMAAFSLPRSLTPHMRDVDCGRRGYHVFAFWSSKYIWVSHLETEGNGNDYELSKKLRAHESEIFHVKPVDDKPQYIGSDIHFTCGFEVSCFKLLNRGISLSLKNEVKRSGFVYLYLPLGNGDVVTASMNGHPARVETITKIPTSMSTSSGYVGKVVRVWVVIHGNNTENDGKVIVTY